MISAGRHREGRLAVNESDIRRRLLSRFNLRAGEETTRYVLRRLADGQPIPVMGGDARTGVAVRLVIDPRGLAAATDLTPVPHTA
jgi:hypothetical protein